MRLYLYLLRFVVRVLTGSLAQTSACLISFLLIFPSVRKRSVFAGAHRAVGGTAARKHAAFVRARGQHYSNEAEAMKVRTLVWASASPTLFPASRASPSVPAERARGRVGSSQGLLIDEGEFSR